jgi:hypothetical protein
VGYRLAVRTNGHRCCPRKQVDGVGAAALGRQARGLREHIGEGGEDVVEQRAIPR